MNKFVCFIIHIFVLCGCTGVKFESNRSRFVNERNYDVGRNVNWSYAMPAKGVVPHNADQDMYLFENKNGCQWIYYVNKTTHIVESWKYVSSPDKCEIGLKWMGPW